MNQTSSREPSPAENEGVAPPQGEIFALTGKTPRDRVAAFFHAELSEHPFSSTVRRVTDQISGGKGQLGEIVESLAADSELSGRVLQLVNSAGYGLRIPCHSVEHAATLLGEDRLRQITTSAAVFEHFQACTGAHRAQREHGTLVASLGRFLAIHLGLPGDELFILGMLHDIGIHLLLDARPEQYAPLLSNSEIAWNALCDAEQKEFGFDHAMLGAYLLGELGLPSPMPEVIALHHRPTQAQRYGLKTAALVHTLSFCDQMAHLLETQEPAQGAEELARSASAHFLELTSQKILEIWHDVEDLPERSRRRALELNTIAPRNLQVPESLTPRKRGLNEHSSQCPEQVESREADTLQTKQVEPTQGARQPSQFRAHQLEKQSIHAAQRTGLLALTWLSFGLALFLLRMLFLSSSQVALVGVSFFVIGVLIYALKRRNRTRVNQSRA
ncbi:MAG: HDOD domain-containing protein [Polyangiaceae bacterium]|nr:HDOD domain-containing protein [Polyangiaceae bacterium]